MIAIVITIYKLAKNTVQTCWLFNLGFYSLTSTLHMYVPMSLQSPPGTLKWIEHTSLFNHYDTTWPHWHSLTKKQFCDLKSARADGLTWLSKNQAKWRCFDKIHSYTGWVSLAQVLLAAICGLSRNASPHQQLLKPEPHSFHFVLTTITLTPSGKKCQLLFLSKLC